MHKPTLCTLLNISLYVGVALFLFPFLVGSLSHGSVLLVSGAVLAIVSGVVRTCLAETGSELRGQTQRIP